MDLFERSSILVHGIPQLYASKKYVDCKFLVGPDKVPFEAHKLILAMASEAFEEQLYSDNTSDEPILVPDVDPDVFEAILRYIYLNEHPYTMRFSKDVAGIDQHNLIKLWYITSKYELDDLKRKYLDEIKINITNWFVAYNASKMLLNGPLAVEEQMKLGSGSLPNIIQLIRQDERKNVERIVIRCQKVFSVKTPDALGDSFIKRMPERFLKDLFAVEYMSIENELALFKFLVRYAHENGWKPNDEYFLDKDENGTELATPFQGKYFLKEQVLGSTLKTNSGILCPQRFRNVKVNMNVVIVLQISTLVAYLNIIKNVSNCLSEYIREAMKQIRFLSMTLKVFDSIPSKSGFFTEFEVKKIRDRIADDSCQCVSVAGFSTVTNKKRHELLNVTFLDVSCSALMDA
ncbi:hypothetical protein ABMA28_012578 [Loxostege sticticalis]|uniref:BTB domain-containing protein n=1 Tax=Loxostege sticticalis TaxID=481309 RepID=A0ABD0S4E1_LOXSC